MAAVAAAVAAVVAVVAAAVRPRPPCTSRSRSPPAIGVILDTRGTTGATAIKVDVNGDGRPDYSGPATLPFLKIAVPVTTQARIAASASGACGPTSTTSITTPISGTGLPASQMGPRIVAAASPALLTPAALGSTCTKGTVVEGIIDARGCFVQAKSPSALPAATAKVVAKYYKDPVDPLYVTAICKAELAKMGKATLCDQLKAKYVAQPIYVSSNRFTSTGFRSAREAAASSSSTRTSSASSPPTRRSPSAPSP